MHRAERGAEDGEDQAARGGELRDGAEFLEEDHQLSPGQTEKHGCGAQSGHGVSGA